MIRVVEHPKPPLRLLLGEDALRLAENNITEISENIANWRSISESTNFEDTETEAIPA